MPWRTPYLSKKAWSTLDITSSSGFPIPSRHLTSPDIVPPCLMHCAKNVLLARCVLSKTRCMRLRAHHEQLAHASPIRVEAAEAWRLQAAGQMAAGLKAAGCRLACQEGDVGCGCSKVQQERCLHFTGTCRYMHSTQQAMS